MNSSAPTELLGLLQNTFGFQDFRPGQREAIEALLEQRRILCIQPTGHGKSLLYQLPALLVDGVTLVISPLLALMRDQLRHLHERFGIPAATINTDQTEAENNVARQAAIAGNIRILFVAPEQLDNLVNYQFLLRLPVALLVVDEAHCISTWGHDFRPSYRQIVNLVRELGRQRPDLRILGLTATANARTEADIAEQLQTAGGRPLRVLRHTMDRPNLALSLIRVNGPAHKLAVLRELLTRREGGGIFYCSTREQTELVADFLQQHGLNVVSYHAGYDPDRKRQLQRAFIDGNYRAIAATNALGMGIDKPDIRFVVHVDLPGSITAYYQEVGRAGRDGLPAQGMLLFDPVDRRIQDHFIRSAQPALTHFETVLASLTPDEQGGWPTLTGIKVRTGLHPTLVTVIVAELVEQGLVQKTLAGSKTQVYRPSGQGQRPNLQRYAVQQQVRNQELDAILRYGQGEVGCLMQTLRLALGDAGALPCGRCSQCRPETAPMAVAAEAIVAAQNWLDHRDTPIAGTAKPLMAAGLAVLNGEMRPPLFVEFMRQRAGGGPALSPALQALLLEKLRHLQNRHRFSGGVAPPSRTWLQRDATLRLIGETLNVPVYGDLLVWDPMPAARQGELLNNDQRRQNVNGKMRLAYRLPAPGQDALLLLDDYIGSGATLKEAVSVLRKGGLQNELVPLTVARVRWRLGARGII